MRYMALAVDYDGTIAKNGKVTRKTLQALERVKESGRHVILVTGRQLDDLINVFPQIEVFERVVAENGALLYNPRTKEETVLGEPVPEELVNALRQRKVKKLTTGHSIVATVEPYDADALDVIQELGLERQIIFNKGAVMILPSGVNKETGLRAALSQLGLSEHNTIGVGDAENDHAFLARCECAVAVANAINSIKERADIVTEGDHGAGIVELVERLLADDLADITGALTRHDILFGMAGGKEVRLKPAGTSILVAGPSGSGKSTATTAILERLGEAGYQFCLIDPEGDYERFPGAVVVGSATSRPELDEVTQLLSQPEQNVVVSMLDVPLDDRPGFFAGFLPRLLEMRIKTGRPHWIVVDEAHHLLPASWKPAAQELPQELSELLLITVHPESVSPAVLASVNTVIAVGGETEKTVASFARAAKARAPKMEYPELGSGEVLLWRRGGRQKPITVTVTPAQMERRRHQRKYATGEIPEHEHFFYRGPREELNLRSQNLFVFLQNGDGVDDETWEFHLERGDFTNWFRHVIKDEDLAQAADRIAAERRPAGESRKQIREEVERRYTLPA